MRAFLDDIRQAQPEQRPTIAAAKILEVGSIAVAPIGREVVVCYQGSP